MLLPRDMLELRGLRKNEVFIYSKRYLGMVKCYLPIVVFLCKTHNCHAYMYVHFLLVLVLIPFFFLGHPKYFYKLEEMTNSYLQQLDEERKRRDTTVQTLAIAENSNTELKKKLTAEEKARKSADSALEGAERQAKSHRKLAREANDQLAASKKQLAALKKQLEEVQKGQSQS